MTEQFLNKAGTQIIANKIKEERAVRQNLALQLNTLKGVAMTMYASESLLPSAIDFENGVVVAVGEIAWCVAEKTWHRVSAVNSETLAITWSDYDPHIQADIDLSKYSKNLIIDKAENITAAQKEEYDTFDTTDNECGMVFGEVAEGDHNAVDGDSVYKAIAPALIIPQLHFVTDIQINNVELLRQEILNNLTNIPIGCSFVDIQNSTQSYRHMFVLVNKASSLYFTFICTSYYIDGFISCVYRNGTWT